MEILFSLILVLIGLILITLEVFFLPGLIVGILGGILIFVAVIYLNLTYGFEIAIVTFVFSLFAGIILFLLFKKFKISDRFILKEEQKSFLKDDYKSKKIEIIGKKGISLTDLKPSGFVLIEGGKFDVQSSGEFIPKNSVIEIISIEGSKIFVKKLEEKS
ncbi:MAG: NfeD family protein [Ignavibacteria bacterium]